MDDRLSDYMGKMPQPRVRKRAPYKDAMATVQARSANRKLAPQRFVTVGYRKRNEPIAPFVASTYVSIAGTCPKSCRFLNAGCYAQAGIHGHRLDRTVAQMGASGDDVISEEVNKIDRLYSTGVPQAGARGGVDLRLHVSGDVPNTYSTKRLAAAVKRYQLRDGGDCWTFTHRWRQIDAAAWGSIVCLASVERVEDAVLALDRGYAPALTVKEHSGAQAWKAAGIEFIPCPAQTREVTCSSCRLCLTDGLLTRDQGISFAIHGLQSKRALVQVRRGP